MAECRKKDIDMMKGMGKNKRFGKGKNSPPQQMMYGKGKGGYGNDWTGNDRWASSWKVQSGVHSVEEQYAWQSGPGTTLFGLEVRTSNTEEAQNKGETLQNENVQCAKVATSTLEKKTWKMCGISRF